MKKSHFIFESVLLGLTLLLCICSLGELATGRTSDIIFFTMIWWAIFGFLQFVHAVGLTANFWNHIDIRKHLTIYFIGVGVDFLLIFICLTYDIYFVQPILFFIILPAILAIYLWYITYKFRKKAVPELQIENKVDLFN